MLEVILGFLALSVPGVLFGLLTFGAWTLGSRRCRDGVWIALIACLALAGYRIAASIGAATHWYEWEFFWHSSWDNAPRFDMVLVLVAAALITAALRGLSGRRIPMFAGRSAPPLPVEYLLWALLTVSAGFFVEDLFGKSSPRFTMIYEMHGTFSGIVFAFECLIFVPLVIAATLLANTLLQWRLRVVLRSASATGEVGR